VNAWRLQPAPSAVRRLHRRPQGGDKLFSENYVLFHHSQGEPIFFARKDTFRAGISKAKREYLMKRTVHGLIGMALLACFAAAPARGDGVWMRGRSGMKM